MIRVAATTSDQEIRRPAERIGIAIGRPFLYWPYGYEITSARRSKAKRKRPQVGFIVVRIE